MEEDTVEEAEEDWASASGVVLLPGPMLVGVGEDCPGAATSLVVPEPQHRGHISRHTYTRECQLLLGMHPIRLR
jgi:hypothetical protein